MASIPKGKPIGLLKQAWNEIPDIVAGTALAVSSIIGSVLIYKYKTREGEFKLKKYKLNYTVVRSDDPLAQYVRPKES